VGNGIKVHAKPKVNKTKLAKMLLVVSWKLEANLLAKILFFGILESL